MSIPQEQLYIGGYTITRIDDTENDTDKFWITNDDGEGMQTTEAKLTKMLDEFWKQEF